LLDLRGTTLRAGAETLERGALVDEDAADVQILLVEELAGCVSLDPSVRHCRGNELVHGLARALRGELQDGQGLLSLLALDQGDDATGLLRGHADVSHTCDGIHHFFLLLCRRLAATALLVVLLVAAEGAGGRKLAQ